MTGTDARKPSGKPRYTAPLLGPCGAPADISGYQLKRDPGDPASDQRAQSQFRVGVAPERPPRPPNHREHGRKEDSPSSEDTEETNQRPGDSGHVKRAIYERCKSGEGPGRESVRE